MSDRIRKALGSDAPIKVGRAKGPLDVLHQAYKVNAAKKRKMRRCPVCSTRSSLQRWENCADFCPKCGHLYPEFL